MSAVSAARPPVLGLLDAVPPTWQVGVTAGVLTATPNCSETSVALTKAIVYRTVPPVSASMSPATAASKTKRQQAYQSSADDDLQNRISCHI